MSEVTSVAFDTVLVMGVMLAQCRLIKVVQLLSARLLLCLRDRNGNEPGKVCLRLRALLGSPTSTLMDLSYSKNEP